MKRHAVLAIAVSLFADCALAQSHVTVYGSLGAALRVKTHASPGGASAWAIGPSPNAAGIWGVWGTEEIGGGFKGHFNLESGFDLDTGSLSYSGLNWGREALVGLTTPFGRFDAGRLQVQGLAVQPLVMADPMGGNGSFAETIWPGLYTGSRYSNALRWRANVGPISGSLFTALGESSVPSTGAGRTLAATLGYKEGPLYMLAAIQSNHDMNDRSNEVSTLAATYITGATTWHAAALRGHREQGFVMGGVGEPLAASGLGLGPRVPSIGAFEVRFVFAGITQRLTAVTTVKLAWYYARSDGGTLISTDSGKQQTCYAVLEHAFSKRTFFEASFDRNRWTGGWGGFWGSSVESGAAAAGNPFRNGFDTRASLSAGLRHEF